MNQGFDRVACHQQLQAGLRQLGLSISEAGTGKLLDYLALLTKWNKVYNLTAVREPQRMVTQHLLDSLAAVPAVADSKRLLDVGSGGGLPGIVFAIWAQDAGSPMRLTLVDTVAKKTAFLTQVKAQLGLDNLTVLTARVEKLPSTEQYDVITSRAFAELADFINWSAQLLAPAGRFVALKGVLPTGEIDKLPWGWKLSKVQALQVPGLDAQRHIIEIRRADPEVPA